ncbi:hypothetical protein M3Y99_00050400 [Aphelenchoides fujianensis]|nr:hypothetical protein M3Y99_00050400 [Aphelenchoides fujianensis]
MKATLISSFVLLLLVQTIVSSPVFEFSPSTLADDRSAGRMKRSVYGLYQIFPKTNKPGMKMKKFSPWTPEFAPNVYFY